MMIEHRDSHTYMVHLQFSAHDDEHARQIAAKFNEVVEQWHEFVERDLPVHEHLTIRPHGYVIEASYLTDADDWAEHVGTEDVCSQCMSTGVTDRLRAGDGNRWCQTCIDKYHSHGYSIEDMQI